MEYSVSTHRVVNRYLTKIAEEKSLNLQIDEKFKTWKGKNPNTGNDVGYWTVKGWKQITKKQLAKDSQKSKLKDYALKVFNEFAKSIQGDSDSETKAVDDETKKIQKSISEMVSKPNLGLPEKVFKQNKFALEIKKPSRNDVKALAEDLREGFKTPGFQRGVIRQNIDVLGTDEWINRTAMMVARPLRALSAELSKDDDFKEAVREAQESNPEVGGAAKNLAANWTQSTIAPMVIASATGVSGVSIGGGVQALVTAGLSAAGVGGAVATAAPLIASVAVGAVMYKKLFHGRSKKAKGKLLSTESDLPDSYDNLASDIYAGYATPESVEAEYNKKLDDIINDESLDPDKAREKILELYEDFDTNARPSIDKGLYQLGKTEGSGAFDFLKRGAEEKKGTPILIKLLKLKDQYDAQEQIAKMVEENPDEISDLLQKVLNGEEELPQDLIDGIQGKKPKEEEPKEEKPKEEEPKEENTTDPKEVSQALENMIESIVDKKLNQKKGQSMRRQRMTQRVASAYMRKHGFLGKLLELFKEPEKVQEAQKKRPQFDVASVWLYGNPLYGKQVGEVQHKLGMGRDNTAIIEVDGLKIKLSVSRETYQQGENKNVMNDLFVVVTMTGVDENIPKRTLQKVLLEQMQKARLSDKRRDMTKVPKGRKY